MEISALNILSIIWIDCIRWELGALSESLCNKGELRWKLHHLSCMQTGTTYRQWLFFSCIKPGLGVVQRDARRRGDEKRINCISLSSAVHFWGKSSTNTWIHDDKNLLFLLSSRVYRIGHCVLRSSLRNSINVYCNRTSLCLISNTKQLVKLLLYERHKICI